MSGGDYKYVNPPKLGIPSWGELLDKGSNSIILGEIGENLETFFMYPLKRSQSLTHLMVCFLHG